MSVVPKSYLDSLANSQTSSALAAPSMISATSTQPTTIAAPKSTSSTSTTLSSPAAQNYMSTLSQTPVTTTPYSAPTQTSTQNTPTTPDAYTTAKTDYMQAYKDYLSSLGPSSDVTSAKTKYNDYIASAESGIKGMEGQGRGIPLALVRGAQAKLGNQAEIEAKRLQGDIGIAQDSLSATQNAKFANLGLKEKLLGLEKNPNESSNLPAMAQEYEYAKKNGYKGTFTDYQNEDANRKKSVLTPGQVSSSVNQIAGAFDNEPIVREYNTVASTIKGLENAGTSPTDDIQRIYAFAKIMDPNSAVREGEYKTIQDYSVALLQRLGINLQRAFDARGFLTDDARNAMKTTLNNILAAKETTYKSLYDQYQRQINDAYSGTNRTLTDYSAGYSSGTSGTTSGTSGSTGGNIFAEAW